jgi:16S rRNA (cytosine1402-N4)-methyltransferase
LVSGLFAAERALAEGGRLAVVTFHSLEDRIVKRFIADRTTRPAGSRHMPETTGSVPTFEKAGKPVAPSDDEVTANPRARSARLRSAVRTAAPPRPQDTSIFGLPRLPAAERSRRV